MEEKKQLIIEYIDRMRDDCLKRGFVITDDVYQKVLAQFLNSPKSLEEIKREIDLLVLKKFREVVANREKELLKQVNIEDYQDEILTIKSLDRWGYPNFISSRITVNGKVDFSHNAPTNVNFANKNGFYKNSANTSSASLDKFEYIICQIGKMFGVKMAETYKVSKGSNSLGIISENVCNPNESLCMYSQIIKLLNVNNPNIQESIIKMQEINARSEKSDKYETPMVEDVEDITTVIDSFLQVCDTLKISEEQKRRIRQDYFNMIMLDFVVNNVDRNKNNYGFIISEDGCVRFAPLFDNSTIAIPDMPKGYQQVNGFLINKQQLLNCLYTGYYDDIKVFTQHCVQNGTQILASVDNLCTEELSPGEQEWFLGEFTSNLHTVAKTEITKAEEPVENQNLDVGPKLVRTKPEPKKEETSTTNNEGKINIIMLLLSVSLVIILITIIFLFKIYL